jgi:ABC-2 type transport system permease protein
MSNLARLARTEAKLFLREPIVLIFVFAFPVITVLVLGGVFKKGDTAYEGAAPSDYYVAGYIGVVLAAIGLIMLPVHLASYRERGVLRRFRASQFPSWALPAAWGAVATVLSAIAIAVLLGVGALVYGLPAPHDLTRTIIGVVLGTATFISLGIFLGLLLPTARSAQGLGLMLFFPFFLLGGAGPPPDAMGPVMKHISNFLPLTHAIRAIQQPWLAIGGPATNHLIVLAGILILATAGSAHLANRTSDR